MATRAFLLCGDEKAVQAVTQILDELEVSFEHSSEPGFSLKRLATQRFDLLIVDCDNAQNATQVFNSARASNLNKTSIAIAIVEGKAGVPNAFRLGASLVLTKPVSLEQARNTLRTGIGMTRKDAQDVKPAAPAVALPAAPSQTSSTPTIAAPVVPQTPAPTIVAPRPTATPAVLTPVAPPVPTATKPVAEGTKLAVAPPPVDKPAASRQPMVPVIPPQEHKPALTNFTESPTAPVSPVPPAPKVVAAAATSTPTTSSPATKTFDSVFKMPAAEGAKPKTTDVKAESKVESAKSTPALSIVDPLAEEDVLDPVKDHGVPSFGALGKDSFAGLDSDSPRKGKGGLIAAVVVLFVGAGVYGAWATQPEFKKFVAWEYLNTMSKISTHRGQPQVVAEKPAVPTPVQAPVTSPTVATTPDPSAANLPADPSEIAGPGTTTSAGAGPNAQPGTDSGTTASASDRTATKGATVQPAKRDLSASHTASSATLVPTSLPATPVAKAPSGELLEVPEDFADDQIVHRVHPMYPKQARARKLHGTVVLEAIVNKKGSVDSLQLVSGDSMLAQAAADAVKQWKYKPYFHNGEPTEFQTKITIDFKLP
jgi:periplasmic protein TonB